MITGNEKEGRPHEYRAHEAQTATTCTQGCSDRLVLAVTNPHHFLRNKTRAREIITRTHVGRTIEGKRERHETRESSHLLLSRFRLLAVHSFLAELKDPKAQQWNRPWAQASLSRFLRKEVRGLHQYQLPGIQTELTKKVDTAHTSTPL